MARFEADINGKPVRLVPAERESMPTHPATTQQIQFDDVSNAALLADMQTSTDPYTLAAGVLKKNGVVQVVAADHPDTVIQKFLRAQLPTLKPLLRAGTAPWDITTQKIFLVLINDWIARHQ